jgi:hypothetical protein
VCSALQQDRDRQYTDCAAERDRHSSSVFCTAAGQTDGTLTVQHRGTGTVTDNVFCTAADLLGASYDEPTKIELNSV